LFYENLIDLANVVPGILLGAKPVNDTETVQDISPISIESLETVLQESSTQVQISDKADEDRLEDGKDKNWKNTLDSILARLLNGLNKEIIDSLAVEFAVDSY
jgi:hypothetical protein